MNTSSKKIRIAIIGGGIIGLYLAWRLAGREREVVVFERKSGLGGKACSGIVSQRLERFIPPQVIPSENKLNSFLIHFSRKNVILRLQSPHLVINRTELDKRLGQLAQKKGVNIVFNKSINEKLEGFDKIIACDGALSGTRKRLDLSQPLLRSGIFLRIAKKNYSHQAETWPIKTGFIWKVPRGEFLEYGALAAPDKVKKYFFDFLRKRKIIFNPQELKSHLVPENIVLPESNNITLCGDSAGLTKPWSGGGIIWGLTAADMLVKHFPDLQGYRQAVVSFFGPRIRKGKIERWLVHYADNYFSFLLPREIHWNNDAIN